MSRWVTTPFVVHRPDPNTRSTWALAVVAPVLWGLALAVFFGASSMYFLAGLSVVLLLPLGGFGAAIGFLLAREDAVQLARRSGAVPPDPRIALVAPALYLLLRSFREEDPRAGRPFWTSVLLAVLAPMVVVLAYIGQYGLFLHG